jgi:hypothetical protein
MMIVSIILIIVAAYLAAGFVFAVPFVLKGVSKIDEGAHGASWGFRIIILPGAIIFWPFLLSKWIKALKLKEE